MSQLFTLTKQLTAAASNNICQSQTTGGAGPLVINGSAATGGVATLDSQRRLALASGGDDSAVHFTITGTNDAGTGISEVIAGPNANTVATQQDFKTIISIVGDAAVAQAITVGTNTTGATPWFVPDYHLTPFEVAAGYEVLSGSQTASVETTDDPLLMPLPIYQAGQSQALPIPIVAIWPGLAGLQANASSVINRAVAGIRLTVTAGTGKGRLNIRQSGLTY